MKQTHHQIYQAPLTFIHGNLVPDALG